VRHRRPTRLKTFDYKGRYSYFVTCSTFERRKRFTDCAIVNLVTDQILRTCNDRSFEVVAYGFMEDHLHLVIRGTSDASDFRSTMKLLRQRTAIACRHARSQRLWQGGYHERVLRREDDVSSYVKYVVENPIVAGMSPERSRFPYVWSKYPGIPNNHQ